MKLLVRLYQYGQIICALLLGHGELTVSFTQTSFTVTEGGEAVPVCLAATPALVGEAMVVVSDCIFKILPMQRYSAQEQYRKATSSTSTKSMPEIVIQQKLKVS